MRFWISVHLPLLPLETFRTLWSDPGLHVVLEREQVLAVLIQAADAGVRIGMRGGSVAAIAPDAVLHERDPAHEQEVIDSIAMALLQYTPEVAHTAECSLVLDVTASLRAFGGRRALVRLVRASIAALGFTALIGTAPTAQGAWLLSRYAVNGQGGQGSKWRRSIKLSTLRRRLDALPFTLLPDARPYQQWFEGIGCQTLADVKRLPREKLLSSARYVRCDYASGRFRPLILGPVLPRLRE